MQETKWQLSKLSESDRAFRNEKQRSLCPFAMNADLTFQYGNSGRIRTNFSEFIQTRLGSQTHAALLSRTDQKIDKARDAFLKHSAKIVEPGVTRQVQVWEWEGGRT